MNELSIEGYNHTSAKNRGDSLELAVEHIFSVAGFNTKRNVWIAKYEIDVQAEIGDRRIIIECKNYQSSTLTIRNLIHQWNSKNQVIKAHKIIIALAGLNIKEDDYKLANEFDIELWSQDDISELFNLSLKPDELRTKLIEKIDFRPITISERYRDEITSLVIKPLLSNIIISEEQRFRYFNKWLRAHILTELQMTNTTPDERANLVTLFEGSKTKKGFLNLVTKKRKETEYWNTVFEQLKSSEILSRDRQDYYINHMNDLLSEFDVQSDFFKGSDYLQKTKKLIVTRIQNALYSDHKCSFRVDNMTNHVKVLFSDREYIGIYVTGIVESQSNVLNWIMTSQCTPRHNDQNELIAYKWICSSLEEATEKVYRIFTEYYKINEKSKLIDSEVFYK